MREGAVARSDTDLRPVPSGQIDARLPANTEAVVGVQLDAIFYHDQRTLELHLGAGTDRDQRYLVGSPQAIEQVRDGAGAIAAGAESDCGWSGRRPTVQTPLENGPD
jgi:hypothetical protein